MPPTPRTPGQEALHEAMRLEQARIYGQLCKEPPSPTLADRADMLLDSLARVGAPVTKLDQARETRRPTMVERRQIEQAIARTGSVQAAALELNQDEATVQRVWEAMSA